jgi:hypothetical protein
MEIPSYYSGLLSSDEMDQLKRQSLYSGLLGFGQALAESSAPSLTPRSTLSGVSRGLSGFNQGYQGQVDAALGNMLKGAQVKQMLDKQKQEAQLKELYKSALVPQYQTTPAVIPQGQTMLDDQGVQTLGVTPEQRALTGYQFDMQKVVPMLAATGNFAALEQLEKASSLLGGGTMKPTDVAGQVKEAIQVLGIKDPSGRLKTPDKFTPEDQERVKTYINASDSAKAPKIDLRDPTAVTVAQQGVIKDFQAITKDMREVSRRYNGMVGAWRDKSNPATDSTLIYGLAKIYDPAGAVQQGDIATIKGSRSIPQSVVGFADRIARGGTLTESERDNIMSTAFSLVNSYSKQVQPDVDTYRSFSSTFKADPNQIKNPFENMAKPDYIKVTVAGKQVKAELNEKDGEYYYKSGEKYYKVSY